MRPACSLPVLLLSVQNLSFKRTKTSLRKPEFQYIFNNWGIKLVTAFD